MRVTTKLTLSLETGEVLDREWYSYHGPVALCKGDSARAEQAAQQLQQQEFQMMQQSLQRELSAADPIQQELTAIINAGGMLPDQQNALTSIALNSLPAQYNDITGQLSNRLRQSGVTGGQYGGGGAIARTYGNLGALEAGQQASLLSNIQVQKANQLQSALGGELNLANMFAGNTGMFNQGSLGALGQQVTSANNAEQNANGFLGSLFGALSAPMNMFGSIFAGKG